MFYSFVREEGTVPDRCGRPVCFNPDPSIATQCGNHCVQYDKDLRRTSGSVIETTLNQFGQQVEVYDGIPIVVDDFVPDTETQGTGANTSSIWALKFGQGMGLMGLEHGGITIERVGELEQKDATRHRIKWYCGLALFSRLGTARLSGITAG